jgi:NACHT domain
VNLVVAAVLFLLPWAAALVQISRHRHLDSGAVGILVSVSLGLPALWLAVAGYWVAQREADKNAHPKLTEIADGLAGRLRSQWADEAEARRLNDPYPLPVSWTPAEESLAGDLDALRTLATRGVGWSALTRESWATGPEDLAGGGDRKLADTLAAVPTGRLVVLGEPGTGKTMLMVGLVLDLLARRSGGPVPVLASLASWNPASQDLHDWLGATLITGYPDLAEAPPPGSVGANRFEALVEAGLILPVLDGLDEIPKSARPTAIARINTELKPGEPVVITCRTKEYQAAVRPRHGRGAALRAAAVQLSTLEFGEIASYLRIGAGPGAKDRWDFLDTLSTESPVRQALTTPLMAGLARAIYNPWPGELAGALRDPAELCSPALPDRIAVESVLLDEFISAAYRQDSGSRWKTQDVERWLVFLARHLERTVATPDLAWWELLPRTRGFSSASVNLGVVRMKVTPSGSVTLVNGPMHLSINTAAGISSAASPRAALLRARRIATIFGIGYGTLVGFAAGLIAGVIAGVITGIVWAILAWVVFGAGAPLLTPWGLYQAARPIFALNGQLPWKIMGFLEDAHRRGVLRQAGAVYQFRHIELQHRLANRDANKRQANSPAEATSKADG